MSQKSRGYQPSEAPVIFRTRSGKELTAKANPDNITVLTDKLPDRPPFPLSLLSFLTKE